MLNQNFIYKATNRSENETKKLFGLKGWDFQKKMVQPY